MPRKKEIKKLERAVFMDLNLAFLDATVKKIELSVDRKTAAMTVNLEEEVVDAINRQHAEAEEELNKILKDASEQDIEFPLQTLKRKYRLSEFEYAVIQVAVAPVLDSSFKKRIARYKDNVLLDYVDVDFLLNILSDTRADRLKVRDFFLPDSKIVREKLISLTLPRDASMDSLLFYEVQIPERLINFIFGRDTIDKSIVSFCELSTPEIPMEKVIMDEAVKKEVLDILMAWDEKRRKESSLLETGIPYDEAPLIQLLGGGVIMMLSGASGTGKTMFLNAVASALGRKVLSVDSGKLISDDIPFKTVTDNIFFDASLHGAILCFDSADTLFSQKNPRLSTIYSCMEDFSGIIFIVLNDPKSIDPSLERWVSYQVKFDIPDGFQREKIWRQNFEDMGIRLSSDVDLQTFGTTFIFPGSHIRNAALIARRMAMSSDPPVITDDILTKAAYAQIRADVEEYSHKRKVHLTLNDLILPDDELKLVREVLEAAKNKAFIMNKWGFGRKLLTGKGLCVLFMGESGTGKTLCAEILSRELVMNLFQISIPRIMSKYIGETEKNIEKVFTAAKANNAILLFDEADALFSSRVKVETSVDRFSNMEINMLLQEIERFEGIVILTSNLEKNIDKAFERRIQFKIRFPFPNWRYRAKIWKTIIPKECPVDENIDWDLIGKSFELPGGHIKNAIVRAAYMAAGEKSSITMKHILEAAERECKSAGRLFRGLKTEEDF
jgi:SpoVK/Ycf46/Vps4 family AAA+-type ATPase